MESAPIGDRYSVIPLLNLTGERIVKLGGKHGCHDPPHIAGGSPRWPSATLIRILPHSSAPS